MKNVICELQMSKMSFHRSSCSGTAELSTLVSAFFGPSLPSIYSYNFASSSVDVSFSLPFPSHPLSLSSFKSLLPAFSLCITLSASTFECLSSSPVRASKQANSHAALLSQYNEIGSTQIERSHFLQLSTYYRGGGGTYSSTSKGHGGEWVGGDGGMDGEGFEVRGVLRDKVEVGSSGVSCFAF